jgi:hypothetical protein
MSGKWVPPHKRGKSETATFKQTGVRFPSNTTGNNTRNVSYKEAPTTYRNTNEEESRSTKYKKISKRLATRKIRNKPVKPLLKRGKTAKRLIKSA